jgi:hypothetical protein
MSTNAENDPSPQRRGRRRDVWMLLVFVGVVFISMSAWGAQRRGEVLETIKGVRTTLDAAPADDRVLGELQREARAEFVNEVERRVLKYGVQEFAISGIGILLTIAGLVGAARSSRENAGDGADDEPGGAEGA